MPESQAIKAAREFIDIHDNPDNKRVTHTGEVLAQESLREYCDRVQVPYSSVQPHVRALRRSGIPALSIFRRGRPPALTEAEDASLVAYIAHLDKLGAYPTVQQVVQAANALRDSRKPKANPVSRAWYPRWIQQHPELRSSRQRPVEAGRFGLEQQIKLVEAWYRRLYERAEHL